MSRPQLLDSALYALLHKDDIAGFNQERPQGPIDMRGGDFRGLDLRQLNAQDVDFTDTIQSPEFGKLFFVTIIKPR